MDNQWVETLLQSALILSARENSRVAGLLAAEVAAHRPELTMAEYYLSAAVAAGARDPELRTALEEVVRARPGFASPRYHLAVLQLDAGEREAAAVQLRLTADLDDGGWRDRARQLLGELE